MLWIVIILLSTLFVAFANGANDNFKGVATLFGSGTADYKKALAWATVTTFAGSVTAFFFAEKLVKTFSGKGLVPETFLASPVFLTSVILGAGLTVFVASKIGIPISTTHSLTGALAGCGLVAVGGQLGFSALGKNFFLPLLLSPVVAVLLTLVVYPLFRLTRRSLKVNPTTCVCVGEKVVCVPHLAFSHGETVSSAQLRSMDIFVDQKEACAARAIERYEGRVLGIDAQKVLDAVHFMSAGAVGFARGLNDTPKIVALSVSAGALGLQWNIGLVALVMALGGIVSARKIAETMSRKITPMNHGQGFTANLIAAVLVIFASRLGVPVSTTHVSCGALFGIGFINGKANWKMIGGIVSAWVLTLPTAAALTACVYFVLRGIGG